MTDRKFGHAALHEYCEEASLGGMTDDLPFRQEIARKRERDRRILMPVTAKNICDELANTGRRNELQEVRDYANDLLEMKAAAGHRGPSVAVGCGFEPL